jgi:hypothetical protein
MTKPAAPFVLPRKRGNPNWGKVFLPSPALATQFEVQVRDLHLSPEMYALSAELHTWCERNRNRCYVPEWLLKTWGIAVDPTFSAA